MQKVHHSGEQFTSPIVSKRNINGSKPIRLTISLPQDHHDYLQKLSSREGVSMAKLIRDAVKDYVYKDAPLLRN